MPGCEKKHHFLLHLPESLKTTEPVAKQIERDQQPVTESQSSASGTAMAPTVVSPVTKLCTLETSRDPGLVEATINSQPRVCFKVVPVKVSGLGSSKARLHRRFFVAAIRCNFCRAQVASSNCMCKRAAISV